MAVKESGDNQWKDLVPSIVILSVALVGTVIFVAWLLDTRGVVSLRDVDVASEES